MFDEIDKGSMKSMVKAFPYMLGAVEPDMKVIQSLRTLDGKSIAGICMVGMGGSAIAGTLCRDLLSRTSHIPLVCIQDYDIPHFIDKNWLVIATSYSGNTEETLSAAQQALSRRCNIFAITSGGKISAMIDAGNTVTMPSGFQPRAALPLLFTVLLRLLETVLGREQTDLKAIGKVLIDRQSAWGVKYKAPQELAHRLYGRIPLFIGTRFTSAIAYRAKCQVNENAKYAAFHSVLPEANHNEIESIAHLGGMKVQPVFLRSMTESDNLSRRIDATTTIYEEALGECIHLRFDASSEIEEMLQMTYYIDLLSLELATLHGADPVPVERILRLKDILSKGR